MLPSLHSLTPSIPSIALPRVSVIVPVYNVAGTLPTPVAMGEDPQVSTYETKSIESVCGLLGAFMENAGLYEEQRMSFLGTIRAMSGALDNAELSTGTARNPLSGIPSDCATSAIMLST